VVLKLWQLASYDVGTNDVCVVRRDRSTYGIERTVVPMTVTLPLVLIPVPALIVGALVATGLL
jgi:hypothetical protein